MQNKWSKRYWTDLGERVLSTLIYGLITLITTVNIVDLSWEKLWPIVVLPTVLSLLKGLSANLAQPESGASLATGSAGPVIPTPGT
jgi:hypothetical protein